MTKITRRFALLLAGVLILVALVGCKKKEEQKSGIILDYATKGVVATEDPEALQKAFDEAQKNAREGMMSLNYKNDAYSEDGKTFSCYIGNSPSNADDLFVSIYADAACTDELFLGQLLRPGSAYESVELERALDLGDHTVYVPHTLIRMVDGEQSIVGQIVVTMVFHVYPF
ncbi:MAG: hypothetical protein IKO14_08780 [Oscillibacter sp.]|nr:hypothetical protein [Oscillibacter sp.]